MCRKPQLQTSTRITCFNILFRGRCQTMRKPGAVRQVMPLYFFQKLQLQLYKGHLESKERFAIKRYLLIIGKKQNMHVLSHTFTYFST